MKADIEKITNFVKKTKEIPMLEEQFCSLDKVQIQEINKDCLNKKALVQFISEFADKIEYAKGFIRIASNNSLKEGYELEIVNEKTIIPIKIKNVQSLKYLDENCIKEYKKINEEIVNAKHAGTMTKKEIKSRDKIAKKVKAKPIKGKDTEENAKYRLATYIELRKRGQEPKGKKAKKKKKK